MTKLSKDKETTSFTIEDMTYQDAINLIATINEQMYRFPDGHKYRVTRKKTYTENNSTFVSNNDYQEVIFNNVQTFLEYYESCTEEVIALIDATFETTNPELKGMLHITVND